jgi:predicted nucleic acid-binding protein
VDRTPRLSALLFESQALARIQPASVATDRSIEPRTRRRLTWDILIALCAQEHNALLVNENESDFKKIRGYVDFEFVSTTERFPA